MTANDTAHKLDSECREKGTFMIAADTDLDALFKRLHLAWREASNTCTSRRVTLRTPAPRVAAGGIRRGLMVGRSALSRRLRSADCHGAGGAKLIWTPPMWQASFLKLRLGGFIAVLYPAFLRSPDLVSAAGPGGHSRSRCSTHWRACKPRVIAQHGRLTV